MKYISICSGIEAATVAWHSMGWQPLAFSEIEPFPSAVLGHHYPDVPNLGDMTDYLKWPEELLAECDLLVGGTPCQAFSVAGKRESLGDERGNLSLVFCNLFHHINEIRRRHGRPPAIVVWENVPGVLSTKDNAFGCLLAGIMGLDEAVETESGKWPKAGFLSGEAVRVGYRIIDAQYFGVAQRRRRVFLVAVPCELVASLGERACPSEILSLRESVLGNPPTRGAAGEGITSSPEGIAGNVSSKWVEGTRAPAGDECYNLVAFKESQSGCRLGDVHATIDANKGSRRVEGVVAIQQAAQVRRLTPTEKAGDPCHPIAAGAHAPAVAFKHRQSIGFNWQNGGGYGAANDGLGVTEEGVGPLSRSQVPAFAARHHDHAMQVRRLTPTECERLQGFPDRYTDVTYRNKPAADGPRYKALGNSMAVPCMAWIGYRIEKATRL